MLSGIFLFRPTDRLCKAYAVLLGNACRQDFLYRKQGKRRCFSIENRGLCGHTNVEKTR